MGFDTKKYTKKKNLKQKRRKSNYSNLLCTRQKSSSKPKFHTAFPPKHIKVILALFTMHFIVNYYILRSCSVSLVEQNIRVLTTERLT